MYLPSDGDLVYEDEVQALVASLYEGINSTVFAYGELSSASAVLFRQALHASALQLLAMQVVMRLNPCCTAFILSVTLLQALLGLARPTRCWAARTDLA